MKPWAVVLVGAMAAAVCGRLGFWQLDRLEQRRSANARMTARLAMPALLSREVISAGDSGEMLDYRRAQLTGRFDFSREIVVVARTFQGRPGVHVVTPLVLESGAAALVERGWVPSADARTVDLSVLGESESAEPAGVLLVPRTPGSAGGEEWPLLVRGVGPALLAARYPYALLPVVLRRTDSPIPSLRPVPLPEVTDGPHLSYAIQWFAFGMIALVGSVVLVRRQGAI